jgi:pimeloyl-ACP methyl ester carboxylesterase
MPSTDAAPPEPSILARPGGAAIAYRKTEGAAPGVVFLGGFRSDMTGTKALFLEEFCRKAGHSYLRFDYFGHGSSTGDFADGTLGRWADDAVAVIDSLTAGPQVLVGSSMGGWIMLLAALARPVRTHALIGVAAAPDFTADLLPRRLSAEQWREIEENGRVVLPSDYDPAGYLYTKALIEDGNRRLLLRGSIPIDRPVRLLHGMRDASVPWRTSLRLAEALSGEDVRVTLVKGGDHRLSTPPDLALVAHTLAEVLRDSPQRVSPAP